MAALAAKVTGRALGKRGFATASVITDWPTIVGSELAGQSQPERLVFQRGTRDRGTLHVRVDGPLATELMHLEPIVIERINAHFGYAAVASLRLHRAPLNRVAKKSPDSRAPRRRAAPSEVAALEQKLSHVDDTETRDILMQIGTSLMERDDPKK